MGFDIVFTRSQQMEVAKDFGGKVVDVLRKKLEKKARMIQDVESKGRLAKRLHDRLSEDLFEVSFRVKRKSYRGFLYALEEKQVLVFLELVEKSNKNRQQKIIQKLRKSRFEVREYAENVVEEQFEG